MGSQKDDAGTTKMTGVAVLTRKGTARLALEVRALVEKERTASATLARKLNLVPTATVEDQAHSFVARLSRSRGFTHHVNAPEVRY